MPPNEPPDTEPKAPVTPPKIRPRLQYRLTPEEIEALREDARVAAEEMRKLMESERE